METIVIDERGIFSEIGYTPHKGQVPLHHAFANHRMVLASCGRRFGKSQVGGHNLTVEALVAEAQKDSLEPKGTRREFWIVGPEYSDAEKEFRVVYNDLTHLGAEFDKPGTYYSEGGGDMDISLFGGRFLVHAKSAKYPQTLVGEGLRGVIMAEAAKLKQVVWTKYIRPTLSDYAREGSWALFTSTPEGKNWFYDLYMRGQSRLEGDQDWFSLRRPSWTNSFVFPGGRNDPEILEMERDMPTEKFKQEIGAEFTEFVGRVFKDFAEETHVGSFPYNPRWPLYLAADKGYRAPNVVLFVQVDTFDNVWIVGEYYMRERTAEEVAGDILGHPVLGPMSRNAQAMYPDPASPEWAQEVSSKLGVPVRGGTGGDLTVRLDLIRKWLKPQPIRGSVFNNADATATESPKLMIDQHCLNTIREFNDYRYPETKDEAKDEPKEHPLKVDDHTPEALGRFMVGHFGQKEDHARGRSVQAHTSTSSQRRVLVRR